MLPKYLKIQAVSLLFSRLALFYLFCLVKEFGCFFWVNQSKSNSTVLQRLWGGNGISGNKNMVMQLRRYGVFNSERVAEVMEKIDRACFVTDGTPPYVDSPMTIGYNATISAPHMHAMCLQLLEQNLQPGMHVLDVGSGFHLSALSILKLALLKESTFQIIFSLSSSNLDLYRCRT